MLNKTPGLIDVSDLAQTAFEFLSESKLGNAFGNFVEKLNLSAFTVEHNKYISSMFYYLSSNIHGNEIMLQ